jgi:hypothetical protein
MIERDFEMEYVVEVVAELSPENESDRLFFPAFAREGGGDGVSVRVRSNTDAWTGTFAFGYPSSESLTRVLSFPSRDHLCVVSRGAGYVVRAADPEDWYRVETFPIFDARPVVDRGLLLFSDFTTIAAYGPRGLVWKTERISWDGLRISATNAGYAWARAWNGNREVSVRVDLRDGSAEGGVAPLTS